VSVVATGIEADAVAQPSPAKVFSFPARPPIPMPTPAASVQATAHAEDMVEVDLTPEQDEEDELLLGADDILTSPVGAPPVAPPEDEDEAAQPTANGGGTLFERMSNIARGAPKAQIDEDESGFRREPIDIPRFLNRQNNQ
jgi:cell division protein FtsZ